MKVYNKATMLDRRRSLRQSATRAEEILWLYVRRNQRLDVKFKRQYSVYGFVIDFYAPSVKLAIEIDGASHDWPYMQTHDRWRQECIEKYGIRFIRFSDDEVHLQIERVIRQIDETIMIVQNTRVSRTPGVEKDLSPNPSPWKGEGN